MVGRSRVNGTINPQGLVQRVQTWVPNPVVGDLYEEYVYTNYRDVGGVMMPRFHSHQDYDDAGTASGGDHAFGLESLTAARINVPDAALTVPDNVRSATIQPVRIETQQLGQGLWLIAGGSHNSVLVEFRDYVAVIEAPLDEARSLAVIAEVNRLVPNKEIRYLVNTHHHWDHLGGIRTYVHEGATVITHENNKPYYQEVLRAGPRTLQPDRFSLYPPEEWAEGYIFETVNQKYVLGDDTRTVELHTIQGLPHVAGMLVAYFPREKILVQADLFNPAATTANANSRALNNNLQRLKLDVQQIVGIHGAPATIAQFQQVVSR
jgi:glyoxylase-like metal-dependent hydrolase (beta-lactamase superfamily II)